MSLFLMISFLAVLLFGMVIAGAISLRAVARELISRCPVRETISTDWDDRSEALDKALQYHTVIVGNSSPEAVVGTARLFATYLATPEADG